MVDDWMSNAHNAAALEGFLANPVAVAYAKQSATSARARDPALAGFHGAGSARLWFGEANGCTATLATKDPEHGGPDAVFVRPILTAAMRGVELVDSDGSRLVHNVVALEGAPTAPEPATGLVTWLREQIAETRRVAEAAHEMAPGPWGTPPAMGYDNKEIRRHTALNAPPAALAQCAAHEAILDLHVPDDDQPLPKGEPWRFICTTCGGGGINEYPTPWPCDTLRALTLAYRHNPGYREEWRP